MPDKLHLTWQQFDQAVTHLATRVNGAQSIYGEPRGGLPLAVALSNRLGIPIVERGQADLWVDDVLDSGATYQAAPAGAQKLVWVLKNLQYGDVPHALQVNSDVWVVFPWETQDEASNRARYEKLYAVNDLYPTIQGEGVLTGTPMILLRLHGCVVGCPFCDTKETWLFHDTHKVDAIDEARGANPRFAKQTPRQIAQYITRLRTGESWVMLTGGEPADYTLQPLVDELHNAGLKVAIETSGTALGHVDSGADWICVSPKIAQPGGRFVLPEALAAADEIKHVVGKPDHIEQLENLLANTELKKDVTICLQPMSQNRRATELCLAMVAAKGWRLSIQTHKYLNIA